MPSGRGYKHTLMALTFVIVGPYHLMRETVFTARSPQVSGMFLQGVVVVVEQKGCTQSLQY
jgi:hypothetical protein